MKKTNRNLRLPLKAVTWMLAAALAMSCMVGVAQAARARNLEMQVAAVYQKAFFETVTLVEGIRDGLEKVMICGSAAKAQELLSNIARQADAAQDNLAALPASLPAISGSLKFVNQTGDYARTLGDRLAAGASMGEEDERTLDALWETCQSLSLVLEDMARELARGVNPFREAPQGQNGPGPDPLSGAAVEPDVEYPVLLYDGPFSDGRQTDRLLAPDDREYAPEEAEEAVRAYLGENRASGLQLTGEGDTPVPCYEFTAATSDGEISLAVTRKGGAVVYMLSENPVRGAARFSRPELVDLAASFLKRNGYPQMAVSYWAMYEGLLTVNFAAVQDGVILYPDLVKVQLSASTGLVCGVEALNYLANHRRREDLSPTLTPAQAAGRLGARLEAEEPRLCVIPLSAGEALCYEFSAQANGKRYLVYIDAHTGQEREIYRLVEDENGQLAM